MKKKAGLLGTLLVTAALAGCGGGGGGDGGPTQPPPPTTFSIGGTASDLAGSGLTLQNNGADSLAITGNGGFTFATEVNSGSSYNVTVATQPLSPTQTCTVTNGSGTASANVTNILVECVTTPPPATTFSIGGTASRVAGSGLTLQNGADSLAIAGNGPFTFGSEVNSGGSYNVTVAAQPANPTQTCTVTNGSGTATADVTNVLVDCVTPSPSVDTDGDGLTDAEEAAIGTYFNLVDTDGDGLTDFEEQNQGGFNPLVADLPTVTIEVVTDPSIEINVTDEDGVSNNEAFNSTLETGQETSYSRSDTESTSATLEASARVYSEASASVTPTSIGGSAKTGTESSVSASVTQERSTSITQNSASSARQQYGRLSAQTRTDNRVTNGGSLRTRIRITNTSNLTFSVDSLTIGAARPTLNGGVQSLGTLELENPNRDAGNPGSTEIANGSFFEADVERTFSNADDLVELMKDPSGLLFTVSGFQMTDIGTVEGLTWGEVSQNVAGQTAQVVIDYGANTGILSGGRTVESYQVATNVPRDENGSVIGESIDVLLGDSIGIPYTTIVQEVVDADGNLTGETRRIINSVRGVETQSIADGFWYVFTSSESADDPLVDFDDIVMQPRDRISIVYLRDQDGDEIFDREEYLLGTSVTETDTDGDGLDDFQEAREGWLVSVEGEEVRRVFSDPLNRDTDLDGVSDSQEFDDRSDPNINDTDGDGIPDDEDLRPTGSDRVDFVAEFFGPALSMDANFIVIATGDDRNITRMTVDWGDGSPVYESTPCLPSCDADISVSLGHDYQNDGLYTVTVTADVDDVSTESRQYTVGAQNRFSADIGLSANNGWLEGDDTRLIADINGDGRDDIVAFGDDGTYTALSNGTGFEVAELQFADFASEPGFGNNTLRRMLAQVAGSTEPDIVVFGADGVYIAVNDGEGNFDVQCNGNPCTEDFFPVPEMPPEPANYANFGDNPRYLSDMTGDGLADIVAFDSVGVIVAESRQTSFSPPAPPNTPYARTRFGSGPDGGGWTAEAPRILADVNGDGLDDIVAFGFSSGSTNYYYARGDLDPIQYSQGQTTLTLFNQENDWQTDRHLRLAADMNGDGRDDVVGFGNLGVSVSYAITGGSIGGLQAPGSISSEFGFDDGWELPNDQRFLADVNGDGLLDIVGFNSEGRVIFALNGDFGRTRTWIEEFSPGREYSYSENPRFMGDVNGDGSRDIIVFDDDTVEVVFALTEAE